MITRTATGWFVTPTLGQRRKIRAVVELAKRARRSPWSEEVVVENALVVGLRFLSEVLEERAGKRIQGAMPRPPTEPNDGVHLEVKPEMATKRFAEMCAAVAFDMIANECERLMSS